MVGPEGLTSAWWGFGGGGGGGGGGVEQMVGEGVLVAQGSLQKPVDGAGLAWATYLAAPEAAELGCVDCVAGHGYVDHMGAGENGGWEYGREVEDLAAPFEDAFVQDLKLFGCGRDELAGVGESGD